MDPALRALHRVKEDILSSWEWLEMNQEMQRLQALQLTRHHQTSALTTKDKLMTRPLRESLPQIETTAAFKNLKARVSLSLAKNFLSSTTYSQLPIKSATSSVGIHIAEENQSLLDESLSHISKACAHLLEVTPNLKCHLKKYFNHPLPRELRPTAWKFLLSESSSEKILGSRQFRVDPGICQKCEAILKSSPTFTPVAHSTVLLKAMQDMILHWKSHRRGHNLVDRDLLLSIPFLYIWKEGLQSSSSASTGGLERGVGKPLDKVTEISDVYCSFMENLPHTMGTSKSRCATDAIDHFSLQVERLLSTEVPKLHKHLTKLFNTPTDEVPFHIHLKYIIQPSVQRMLVGDLPLDVVCYIWDQCFIGRLVPRFQCLAYYVTVWFILLRGKLEHTHSVEAISNVLATGSTKLTVLQFQSELEKRFLQKLAANIGVVPMFLPAHSGVHPSTLQNRPLSSPMKRMSTHTRRHDLQPSQLSLRQAIHGVDVEKEQLKKSVAVLRKKLEEDRKLLSDALKQEKEQHRRELETMVAEIDALKKGVEGSESPDHSHSDSKQHIPSTRSPSSMTEVSSRPTIETMLSPYTSTYRGYTSSQLLPSIHSLASSLGPSHGHSPSLLQTHKLLRSSREERRQPYSPTNLSEKDAVGIWMQILRRFRDGVYLVCHGSAKEKEQLVSNLQQEQQERTKEEPDIITSA